jgi:hypothetical protein
MASDPDSNVPRTRLSAPRSLLRREQGAAATNGLRPGRQWQTNFCVPRRRARLISFCN